MTPTHTPGPWHVEGFEVLHEQPPRHRWEHESIAEVAEHYDQHRQHSAETAAQAVANAELIARAPTLLAQHAELLDAATTALNWLAYDEDGSYSIEHSAEEIESMLRAAVAAASEGAAQHD